jgi:RHS repeat-associated protein
VFLSRGRRAALTLPFAASVWLALGVLAAPAEGSYGVLTRGRGPDLVTLDPEGNRTSIQTPKGPTTTTTYDELGKPLDVTQPAPKAGDPSPVTHFRYDENRNLVRMEDPDGRVTKLEYDELNRLFRTTRDPDGLNLTTTTSEFDEDGRPERILEANGEVTVQTWDELGRLKTRTHEPPATGWTAPWAYTTEERYSYDPNSNLERVQEFDTRTGGGGPPERVTTRGYDKLDRQTSETVTLQDRTTSSVTTEYFKDGRVKSVTDPRGVTSYTYDGQGREETVTTSGGVTRKTYYPDGLVKDITFPNGTKRANAYDRADRLLTIVTTKDEAPVASTAYTYDPNGNRLTQVQTNGGGEDTTVYTYDDIDRLATVTYAPDAAHPNGRTVTYGHDGAGNRKSEVVTDPQTEAVLESKTGHFDKANRLTELTDNLDAGQTTMLAWDRNGNLLSETKAGVTTSYRYDLRDTLAEVERGGQTLARFLGDFDERRVLKIGDPTLPGGSGVQEYVYNGSRLVLDIENGQPTARYEWTNEELVSLLQSGGVRRYFALDGLETVLALTDEQGQATDRLSLDTWGVPKPGTDFGTSGNRFAFTSHRFDTELNLYYAGGRMYSPTIGRFISQDTLALAPNNPDTWNLFSYARANPTRYVDPTGHVTEAAIDRELARKVDRGEITQVQAIAAAFAWRARPAQRVMSDIDTTAAHVGTLGGFPGIQRAAREGRLEATPASVGRAYIEGMANVAGTADAYVRARAGEGAGFISSTGSAVKETIINLLPVHEAQVLADSDAGAYEKGKALLVGSLKTIAIVAGLRRGAATLIEEDAVVPVNGKAAPPTEVPRGGYRVGDLMPDGRIAGEGPGAALKNGPEFGGAPTRGGRGPVEKGAAGVEQSAELARARGATVRGREITFDTSKGRTRLDLGTEEGGELVLVESKKGPTADLNPRQKAAFPALESEGGIPRGKRAEEAGLEPGKPIGPVKVRIDRHE